MQLKDGEFWCENYMVIMNKNDCIECKGRKKCDLKEKVKDDC